NTQAELSSRSLSFSKPNIHLLSGSKVKKGSKPVSKSKPDSNSQGFILMVVSKKGTRYGNEIKEIIKKNDLDGLLSFEQRNNQFESIQKNVFSILQTTAEKIKSRSYGQINIDLSKTTSLKKIPVFAEIRYGSK